MNYFTKVAAALALGMALTGCSDGPSDAQVEQALSSGPGSITEVRDIERINGYEDGDNRYVVEVSYTTVFTTSYEQAAQNATGFESMALVMLSAIAGEWEAGDSIPEQGKLVFVDSENGWVPIQ